MKQKFNWNTSTKTVEEVLEGAYGNDEDEELTEIIKLVLNSCVLITPPEKESPELTVHQLRGKVKVWRESTTLSPSGQHLGPYKYLVTVFDKPFKAEERKELKEIQEEIARC